MSPGIKESRPQINTFFIKRDCPHVEAAPPSQWTHTHRPHLLSHTDAPYASGVNAGQLIYCFYLLCLARTHTHHNVITSLSVWASIPTHPPISSLSNLPSFFSSWLVVGNLYFLLFLPPPPISVSLQLLLIWQTLSEADRFSATHLWTCVLSLKAFFLWALDPSAVVHFWSTLSPWGPR